jgi:hypothetical protein
LKPHSIESSKLKAQRSRVKAQGSRLKGESSKARKKRTIENGVDLSYNKNVQRSALSFQLQT